MRIHNPQITGSLTLSGSNINIDSAGTISGSITSTGSFASLKIADKVQGTLTVAGNTTLQSDLSVVDINASGHITASSNISASGNLSITGNADIDGTLDVDGTSNLDDVDVDGYITASGNIGTDGNLYVTGNADVNGTTNLDDVDVDGYITASGNIGTDSKLFVTGDADIGGNITGSGATLSGNVGIGTNAPARTLDVRGSIRASVNTTTHETFTLTTQGVDEAKLIMKSPTQDAIVLNTGGNSWISGSNVGIGTTSPQSLLHISGSHPFIYVDRADDDERAGLTFLTNGAETNGAWSFRMNHGASSDTTPDLSVIKQTGTDVEMMSFAGDGASVNLKADGIALTFGADSETSLTHIHNGGLILNSAMGLFFRDNGGEYIYSAGDGDLRIQSGDILTTNAKVGIGTVTNINDKLHVEGNMRVTGNLVAQEFHSEYISASVRYTSGSNKFGDTMDDKHQFTGSIQQSGSAAKHYLLTGNVGIGTMDPDYILETVSSDSNLARFKSSGNNNTSLLIDANSNYNANIAFQENESTKFYWGTDASTDSLRAYSNYTSAVVFSISGSGNVGIATTAPTAPLTIEANGSHIHLDTPSSGQNNWITWKDNGSNKWEVNKDTSHNFNVYSYQASANLMQFLAAGTTLEFPTANFLISGSSTSTGSFGSVHTVGRVGIGTNAPTSLFDVEASSGASLLYEDSGEGLLSLINSSGTALIRLDARDGEHNYIYNGGKLGIGTTVPQADLHVSGSSGKIIMSDHGQVTLEMQTNDTAAIFQRVLGSTNTSDINGGIFMFGNDTANVMNFHVNYGGGNSGNNYNRRLTLGQTSASFDNCLVGIGTKTPVRGFEVISGDGIEFSDSARGTNAVLWGTQGGDYSQLMYDQSAVQQVQLHTDGDSFFTGGDVGIGTNDPDVKLHVSSSASHVGRFASSNSVGPVLGIYKGDSWHMLMGTVSGITTGTGTDHDGIIMMENGYALHLAADSNYNPPGLTVSGSGTNSYVGIGTKTPASKLDVYGSESSIPYIYAHGESDDYNVQAVKGIVTGTDGDNAGGWFEATGTSDENVGVYAKATGATVNIALAAVGDIHSFKGWTAGDSLHSIIWGDVSAASTSNNTAAKLVVSASTAAGAAKGEMQFWTNSGDSIGQRMTIDTAGYVGVNTDDPQRQMHINAGSGTGLSGDAGTCALRFTGNNGSSGTMQTIGWVDNVTRTNHALQIGYLGESSAGQGYGSFFVSTTTSSDGGHAIVFKIVSGGDTYTNDGSISSLSDKRAKKNIIDLEDGLSIVNQLKPKTFQYNGKTDLGVDDGKTRFGFIADDVLEVASQYVEIGNAKIDGVEVDDFKSLSTTRMIPMMVKAIQELSEKVEELESKISGSS